MLDFLQYDLIVDARSQREYEEDHIPGAVNLPVVNNNEYAEVGTTHRTDTHRAYLIGVSYSLRNIANAIDGLVSQYPRGSRILVYCFRGGKRSKLWFDALKTIGYGVERLEGGWKAYRRSVVSQLAELPPKLHYHVLCGPTGCGKTRLLHALRQAGEQVLDLEGIARHRGSLLGAIPGVSQPRQKFFESLLLHELRSFDPSRPLWVEAESRKIGALQLPPSLFEAMHQGQCFQIAAPMPERVKLWREDYGHFEENPAALIGSLQSLRPLVGNKEFEAWEMLARSDGIPELFERLMKVHYDPAYQRSIFRHYPNIQYALAVNPVGLDMISLQAAAAHLASGAPRTAVPARGPQSLPPNA